MLARLLTLILLFFTAALSAQCPGYVLDSVECGANFETVHLFVPLPEEEFYDPSILVIQDATGDTVTIIPTEFSLLEVQYSDDFESGTYSFVLIMNEDICRDTITVDVLAACGSTGSTSSSVSGFMWFDADNNGITDVGEDAIDGTVYLEDGNGNVVDQTTASGDYEFTDLAANTAFQLRFEPFTDDLLVPTLYLVNGGTGGGESHMRADFRTEPFTLAAGEMLPSINAGFTACDLSVDIETDEIACNSDCDGELTALATGGVAPYTYLWSNGETTITSTGLCAGDYSVTVVDANGCVATATNSVVETSDLALSVSSTANQSCGQDCDGQATAIASGGTEPYTYTWASDPFQTGATATGLCAGTYQVTVTDADGCSVSTSVEVAQEFSLNPEITIVTPACGDECNGSFTITGLGNEDQAVCLAIDICEATVFGTVTFSSLCPGTYTVTVSEGDCESQLNIQIPEPSNINISLFDDEVDCYGDCTGELTPVVFGGATPYTYLWSNGNTTATNSGLCAGLHSVTVTDANGCESAASASVLEPSEIFIEFVNEPATCSPECDGNIFPIITGGTAPYAYLWSDGSTTSTCPLVCEGEYSLTIVDANGCMAEGSTFLTQEQNLEVEIVRSGGDCDPDGGPFSSELVVSVGQGPYTYEWSIDGSVVSTEADWPDAPPFTAFDVVVTNDLGCFANLNDITRERVDISEYPDPYYFDDCGTNTIADIVGLLGLPGSTNPRVILGSGDTIPYGDGSLELEDEVYIIIGESTDGTCLSGYSIWAQLVSLPTDVFLSLEESSDCTVGNCLVLSGGDLDFLFFEGLVSVTIISPSGIEVQASDLIFCNINEAGTWRVRLANGCEVLELTQLVTEVLPCGSLNGTIYSTTDIDCGPLPDAVTIPFTIVRVTDGTADGTYFTITDALGYYSLAVPPGVYTVTPLVNGQEPVYGCAEALVTVPDSDIITTDIYVPGELMCPEMEVDICMWQQRRCFENSLFLYYYNAGNVLAPDAVLTVELDEFYTDISSDHPFTQVGQTLIFELGDVAFCEFGYIQINFTISCDAPLGETHCVNASITPDGFCDPVPAWNGSLVNITDAVCDGDSVRFTVQNVGDSPMSVPLSYVVVEDGIMMTSEPIVTEPLEASESIEIAVEAIAGLYHLITNQEPTAPTENDPTILIDACDGTVVSGLTNMLSLGNGVPWQETVCLENSGSWDPNDKTGYPTGHTGNMIKPGTRLDYNIRFQNTGTDTAFTVVIRDTLEKSLDLSTFRIGASSHRYRMTIDTNRALTFTFDNIELPDSTTDLAGSQGMISFSIDHDASLQPGDLIENQAAIYFDFNEPIITNLSVHMIEIMGLPTGLRTLLARSTDIKVFPNPVTDLLSIRIPDSAAERGDVFVITDLFGRDLGRLPSTRRDEGIQVGNLPNGFYYLTLVNEAGQAKGRTGFVVATR